MTRKIQISEHLTFNVASPPILIQEQPFHDEFKAVSQCNTSSTLARWLLDIENYRITVAPIEMKKRNVKRETNTTQHSTTINSTTYTVFLVVKNDKKFQ